MHICYTTGVRDCGLAISDCGLKRLSVHRSRPQSELRNPQSAMVWCPGKESRLPLPLRRRVCGLLHHRDERGPIADWLSVGRASVRNPQSAMNFGRRPQTCTEPLPVPETGGALPPHVSECLQGASPSSRERDDGRVELVRSGGLEPPCPAASGPQPDVSTGFHHDRACWCPVRELHPHRLDVSEASCCWKNRTELGCGTPSRTELACL